MPRALIVLVTLAALVLARPADACKCAPPSLKKSVAAAVTIFAGEVTAIDEGAITVAVSLVWKGEVGATTIVYNADTSCRLFLAVGQRVVLLPRLVGGKPEIRQCEHSGRDTPALRARLSLAAGQPHPPAR